MTADVVIPGLAVKGHCEPPCGKGGSVGRFSRHQQHLFAIRAESAKSRVTLGDQRPVGASARGAADMVGSRTLTHSDGGCA